jgi:hypothetical protein
MTLTAIGKINIPSIMCEKCGCAIQMYSYQTEIKCAACGSTYELISSAIQEGNVEMVYEFAEFQCMHKTYSEQCPNKCPAPEMYCKQHTSDEAFKDACSSVKYCKERLAEAEDKLNRMEESKKTWLIEEVSGINEDNPVPKN